MMPLRGEAENRNTYVNLERIPGGTTLLHRCQNTVLGSNCVQKTVPISAGSVAFFEPRLLEELDHQHITPVREAQYDPSFENRVTFVMPWYDGGSVANALLDGHRFSLSDSLAVIRDVLDAIEYVHTRKHYVHRDIKGDNVLMTAERRTGYLSDFGLAAALEADGAASAIVATYEYMAPECATTQRHGPAADVYGVGMVLFEMLNGRFRWEDLDRAKVEQRLTVGRRALPDHAYSPGAFSVHVPDALVAATRRSIHADPAQRYASAAHFLRALNAIAYIDWRHVEGEGVDGTWEGTWPPQAQVNRRDSYRVTSRILERGSASGKRRLASFYRKSGATSWRRIGIADRDVEPDDSTAVRRFFREVAANADHRWEAR
jgi:serine/threonine protein kinase